MTAYLAKIVGEDHWLSCGSGGGDQSRFWPVVEFGEPRCALGLLRNGDWVWCDLENGSSHRLSEPAVIGLLPLLELPYGAVVVKARAAAQNAGVPPELVETALPSRTIVTAALTRRSDYWVDLAARWLVGMPADQIPVEAAEQAARSSDLPQKTRHAVRRALAEIRRGDLT